MTAGLTIAGYASLFGIRDGAGDRVLPGAFAKSLKARPLGRIAMLWQHDPARPIGTWERLVEDRRGLLVVGRLAAGVAQADEAAHLIAAGALSGLSIGFRALRAAKSPRLGERVLSEIDLWEVSLVTFPQVEAARVRLLEQRGKA